MLGVASDSRVGGCSREQKERKEPESCRFRTEKRQAHNAEQSPSDCRRNHPDHISKPDPHRPSIEPLTVRAAVALSWFASTGKPRSAPQWLDCPLRADAGRRDADNTPRLVAIDVSDAERRWRVVGRRDLCLARLSTSENARKAFRPRWRGVRGQRIGEPLKVNSLLTGDRQTPTNAVIVRSSPTARFPARRQREQDPQCAGAASRKDASRTSAAAIHSG
jgi:hypothetical protein